MRVLVNGVSALIKKIKRALSPLCLSEHGEKGATRIQEADPHQAEPADTLVLDFQSSEL